MIRVVLLVVPFVLMASQGLAQEPTKPPTQADLETRFAETMSGATLEGQFTTREEDGEERPLAKDKYSLGNVKKLPNGRWLFETRIQYGEHDVTVPLALEVKWAGDTPVITLDKVLVPGLGTFNARVLVYGNEYAGTWAGGTHGGHLFGVVLPKEASK